MQDRFKFRWYSKIYNEMCDVNCIEPNNEFVNFQQGKFNDISTRINLENGVLMQCTGLKDKNSKLIYEGDIVKQNKTMYCVTWEEGIYGFCDIRTKITYTVEYVMSKKQEVIGNIYENPELLED